MDGTSSLSEKEVKKLAKLSKKTDLTDKDKSKLAKLLEMMKQPAETTSEPAQPASSHTEKKNTEKRKRESSTGPCSDQGQWGANGEWVYPADASISCALCNKDFAFTGPEQAWYAQRGLYAPTRCQDCIKAKKDAKADKVKSGRSGAGICFNCGEAGHLASTCTKTKQVAAAPPDGAGTAATARKLCYVCGSLEHFSRNCPNQQSTADKAKARGCFTCGSTAHMSKECPKRPPPICFNCGDEGHASKLCPQPKRTSGICFGFQKGQCFNKKCVFTH